MKNSLSKKISLFAIGIGSIFFYSCSTVVLTGQTIKETREVSSFSGVSLAISGDVFVTQGGQLKVEVEADKNSMENILTEIRGNILVIKNRDNHWKNLGEIKVYITMPDINQLSVSGSGDIVCQTAVKTDEIDLEISGSGSIEIDKLEAREISAVITGSGDIDIAGPNSGQSELDATITGSGSLEASEIAVSEVDVNITGSGSAKVNAIKELETTITGSGSVYYKGNPLVNANATGSGKTRSMN